MKIAVARILDIQLKTTMKTRAILFAASILLVFSSCKKAIESVKDRVGQTPANVYIDHLITTGGHSSNQNGYKPVSTSQLNFVVKFDNSAIYQTADAANQSDINKLYGFSDNNATHQVSSARIGWRWYDAQLQLFAYVYNNGVLSYTFITAVPLAQEINCSIQVSGSSYLFTANNTQVTMPRAATTPQAEGYLLYPYFGGDETAPHDIHIMVKEV
jgi:hypothetical protein